MFLRLCSRAPLTTIVSMPWRTGTGTAGAACGSTGLPFGRALMDVPDSLDRERSPFPLVLLQLSGTARKNGSGRPLWSTAAVLPEHARRHGSTSIYWNVYV